MLVEFEEELLKTIKTMHEKTAPYLGEFDDKQHLELLIKGSDSFVFVEFVSESWDNRATKTAVFNIHILCTTSSKQQIYRQNNKFSCIKLCEKIDELLQNSVLCNEFEIELKGLKVLHNSISDYGYMYVLTREIHTKFRQKNEFLEQ